ncbi:MAG: outer membrane beta-barrel protein [Terrimonas sp.]|nr:outer membrane beta-barrel protein [Terrimonas sp.]
MRKVLFLLLIVSFIASAVTAQQKKTRSVARLGIKTGMNASHFHLSGLEASSIAADWKTGFVFGSFVEMKISDKLYFQPELLYSSMGGKNNSSLNGLSNLRLNYLSLPASLKFEFAPNFKLSGGLQLSWIIQAKNFSNNSEADVTTSIRNSDIALQGGIEYWPSKKVVIGARYLHGVSDITYYNGTKAFNQGFQFTAGVKL